MDVTEEVVAVADVKGGMSGEETWVVFEKEKISEKENGRPYGTIDA